LAMYKWVIWLAIPSHLNNIYLIQSFKCFKQLGRFLWAGYASLPTISPLACPPTVSRRGSRAQNNNTRLAASLIIVAKHLHPKSVCPKSPLINLFHQKPSNQCIWHTYLSREPYLVFIELSETGHYSPSNPIVPLHASCLTSKHLWKPGEDTKSINRLESHLF
jgi:hypothetical protein